MGHVLISIQEWNQIYINTLNTQTIEIQLRKMEILIKISLPENNNNSLVYVRIKIDKKERFLESSYT